MFLLKATRKYLDRKQHTLAPVLFLILSHFVEVVLNVISVMGQGSQ